MDPLISPAGAASALLSRFGQSVMLLAPEALTRFSQPDAAVAIDQRRKTLAAQLTKTSAKVEFVCTGMFGCYWRRADGLAIAPIWGVVGPARQWCWSTYEDIAATAEAIAKDGDAKAVLWMIDSPGGYVAGLQPAAAAIEACAKAKPSAAFADEMAASSAYWLACATGRITAPPNACVASIGALKSHEEISGMLERAGISIEIIRSAPRKAEGNPVEPLSPAARAELQAEVTAAADAFIKEVVRLRTVTDVTVRGTQGASMTIAAASDAKLADGVETFDQACAALLARVSAPAVRPGAAIGAKKPVQPARAKAAQPKPLRQPARAAQSRSKAMSKTRADDGAAAPAEMDPSTLPPEEQIARYDAIVELINNTADDDNAKIGAFLQIDGIIDAPYDGVPEDQEPPPPADDGAQPAAARTQRRSSAKAWTSAELGSAEAKANPAAALAAQSAGLTFAQFKAMGSTLAKPGGGLSERMRGQSGATSLGGGEPSTQAKPVKVPTSAEIIAQRRKQVSGT